MVYSGKPSPACERCRARRLRCDLARPSCASCIRSNTKCVGYRDRPLFFFRDQSEAVTRKYQHHRRPQRRENGFLSVSATNSESDGDAQIAPSKKYPESNPTSGSDSPTFSLPFIRTVMPPVQELARCHFYTNHIIGDAHRQHMSYLGPIIQGGTDHALDAAVTAVALAAFANVHSSPAIAVKAHAGYTLALSETNRALRDPALCKKDDVLAAVVLLGMFEVVACTDDRFVHRWINHLAGAAKLLEVRGSEQLSTPLGLEIFRRLRPQIIMSNLCQRRRTTTILADLTRQIDEDPETDGCMLDDLAKMGIKVARLYADVRDGIVSQPWDIVLEALKVDAELVSVVLAAEGPWSYRTVAVPALPDVISIMNSATWGQYYHVYSNIAACALWNNYRTVRIIVQEIILDAVGKLSAASGESPHQASLVSQCQQTTAQMVEDICASVPFCFGCELRPEGASSATVEEGVLPSVPADESPRNSSGGFTLMWPLLVASRSGVASGEMCAWIASCLDKIGHSMGINQALTMSGVLRKGMSVDAWLAGHNMASSTYSRSSSAG